MAALRSHLAAFWDLPMAKWLIGAFFLPLALFALFEPFLAILVFLMFGLPCLGLAWLVVCGSSVTGGRATAGKVGGWLRPICLALGLPLGALGLAVLLLWPAVWLGGKVHVYGVLVANYSAYSAETDVEMRKARPKVVVWSYGGFLDNEEAIVWDAHDQPARRLVREVGAQVATCSPLIGHYFDCGMDL
jgi:hypothetical protein